MKYVEIEISIQECTIGIYIFICDKSIQSVLYLCNFREL